MRYKNKQSSEKKENTIWEKICRFRPPLISSCLGALIFCTASLVAVSTQWGETVPAPILYSIYVLAAIFLFAAVWALVLLFQTASPFETASGIAHRHILLFQIVGRRYLPNCFYGIWFSGVQQFVGCIQNCGWMVVFFCMAHGIGRILSGPLRDKIFGLTQHTC